MLYVINELLGSHDYLIGDINFDESIDVLDVVQWGQSGRRDVAMRLSKMIGSGRFPNKLSTFPYILLEKPKNRACALRAQYI